MEIPEAIAIIDDGVNEKMFSISKLDHNIEISENLDVNDRKCYNPRRLSHGTICAGIINKFASDANLVSIKIVNKETQKSSVGQLIKALEWCIENNIKIINLSMGTVDYNDFSRLEETVKFAFAKGIIISAAYNNFNIYTCPASLPCVIGVKTCKEGKLEYDQFVSENINDKFDSNYIANSCFELVDCNGKVFKTPRSNSFAAPLITAEIHKILKADPNSDFYKVNSILRYKYTEHNFSSKNIVRGINFKRFIETPIVAICNLNENQDCKLAYTLKACFVQDGYNAILFSDSNINNTIPLVYYYDSHKNEVSQRTLKIIESVYKPDVIIVLITKAENVEKARRMPYDLVVSSINSLEDLRRHRLLNLHSRKTLVYSNRQNHTFEDNTIFEVNHLYNKILKYFTKETSI